MRYNGYGPPYERTTIQDFIAFNEWQEERAKKIKEEVDKKGKDKKSGDTFFGVSYRELFWYLFMLSPVVGLPMSFLYLGLLRMLIKSVGLN